MDEREKKKKLEGLSPLQYKVTQEEGTEAPFNNEYWNETREGVYVDIVSGEPLFSSQDKYDSGSGWPSFTKPIEGATLNLREDFKLLQKRIEVRSLKGDSHLGHVFDDGPEPTGKRYCINSSSLKFIPLDELDDYGLFQYRKLFNQIKGKGTFAAGCFWGVEAIFQRTKGVLSTTVGYIGGMTDSPDYLTISTGMTGHAEAVEVIYDPSIIQYEELLDLFFRLHDPTTLNRQGPDVGSQYRSAIFYHSEEQKEAALLFKRKFDQDNVFGEKSVTEITPAKVFFKAEDYHQDYYQKKYRDNGGVGPICHVLRDR